MPENLLKEKIEARLLEELRCVRVHYYAKECDADEYVRALKHFNDFIIVGIWPDDLKPPGKPEKLLLPLIPSSIAH
jgi:hypothetical protein